MNSNPSLLACLALGIAVGVTIPFVLFTQKGKKKEYNDEVNTKEAPGMMSNIGIEHPSSRESNYNGCVYLDYNATTPIFPEVAKAMSPYMSSRFGNPSSPHVYAKPCRDEIIFSRQSVGALINASAETVIFTSCGSESDNRAVDIALHHYNTTSKSIEGLPHVITSIIEHPAIFLYLKHLQHTGKISLTVLPVDKYGFVSTVELFQRLTLNTALVTIMHSNNEVGTLQPISDIADAIKKYNVRTGASILFHSDGAQSVGKVPIDVRSLGVDMFTIVGHKFGASKGIAALYVRENVM